MICCFLALNHLVVAPQIPAAGGAVERIKAVVESGGNFMSDDHTLAHFRDELWDSFCFSAMSRTLTDDEIIEKCHRKYTDKIVEYKNAHYPDKTITQLKKILRKAKTSGT